MESVYRSSGDRCRGGVSLTQAFGWNVGTCRSHVKGKVQGTSIHENESTNGEHRGGVACSNIEMCESTWSEGATLFSRIRGSTGNRRNPWRR